MSSWDFVIIPVITPRLANIKQLNKRVTTKIRFMEKFEGTTKPTVIISRDAKSPFTIPARTSPIIIEKGLTGD
ncbi:hypothetical protein THER_0369 [Thermodesulfovibrio sp. N1]|nr:hypothetical protein THER_0369 [Thermodesulfovibrio sp. N1]